MILIKELNFIYATYFLLICTVVQLFHFVEVISLVKDFLGVLMTTVIHCLCISRQITSTRNMAKALNMLAK